MSTAPLAHTDVIVLDYLAALWAQSEDLSPQQRDELMNTVADYISARRMAASSPLEDAAAIVQRLGPPEALVEAVRRGQLPPHIRLPALIPPPFPPPSIPVARAGGAAEYTAVGMLTVGAFIVPVVAPVAGMLLASASPHLAPAEKAIGWTLTAGSAAAGAVLLLFFATISVGTGAALMLVYLAMCVGPLAAGVNLLGALRRRGEGH
jgi:hypothetical protein